MSERLLVPTLAIALSLGLSTQAWAKVGTVWSEDHGKHTVRSLGKGVAIVADKTAPGGKAVQLTYERAGRVGDTLCHTAQRVRLAGPVTVVLHVRGKGLVGLCEQLRIKAHLRNDQSGRTFQAATLVQGVRVSEAGYVALPFTVQLPARPADYHFYTIGDWLRKKEPSAPVVWVGRIELRAHDNEAAYISQVQPDKNAYRPGQAVRAVVTVVNPTGDALTGRLVATELRGLQGKRDVARQPVSVKPNAVQQLTLTWKAQKPDAGRELRVQLVGPGAAARDAATAYYGVATDPSYLACMPLYDAEAGHGYFHSWFYVGPASYTQSLRAVRHVREQLIQRKEFFSWSYNELAAFIPPADEEPYLGNEGIWWQSFKKQKQQFRLLRELGVPVITYVNGHLWGPAGYKIYQQHPEWFMYGKTGELKGNSYDMQWRAKYERRHEFDFVQEKQPFFYGTLIPTLPATRRHIANQFIRLAKELGFEGARWDVWNMNVAPGDRDLFGKELAPTWAEADRQSAESLAAVKALVAKEVSGFTWGYNYCSPEENEKTPLVLKEKCRDGGWMLDEVICSYQTKTSPFHYWDVYRDRIVGWGDRIRQLGGIYNPFAFRRGGGKYAVDRLYEGIFRLLGGGRASNIYSNRAGLAGRLPLLAFRYSDLLFGWKLRLQPPGQKLVRVRAPDTLWWQQLVFTTTSDAGRKQTIVHLVNSPTATEVEENPNSTVRPPVRNIVVTCAARNGQRPKKAWLVTAESLTPQDEPKVQAVPLKLSKNGSSVTVPCVLFWKTVVFEY